MLCQVTLTVNRVGPLHTSLEVDFETRDHTAKAGMKYVEQSGTLRFGKMEASKTFTVSIVDNNTYDGDLDFYVVLTNTNCVLPVKVTNAQATITIVDDDDPGIVAFNQVWITWMQVGGRAPLHNSAPLGWGGVWGRPPPLDPHSLSKSYPPWTHPPTTLPPPRF